MSLSDLGWANDSLIAAHHVALVDVTNWDEADYLGFGVWVSVFLVGLWVSLPVMVVIHELGHAVVARLCGSDVPYVRVGAGPNAFRFKVGSTTFEFNKLPVSGFTIAIPPNTGASRWIAISLAGVAAELCVVGLMWSLGPTGLLSAVWWAFVTIAAVHAVMSLWPKKWVSEGQEFQSDGLSVFQALRSPEDTFGGVDRELLVDQFKYFVALETGDSEGGLRVAKRLLDRDPSDLKAQGAYGTALAFNARWHEAYGFLMAALEDESPEPVLCNNAALAAVMTFDDALLPEADRLSEIALAELPDKSLGTVTRIAALVVLERYDEALVLSAKSGTGTLTKPNRATRYAFAALANHKAGRRGTSEWLMKTARRLDPDCPALDEMQKRIDLSKTDR